jgi:hypothetical protein
MRIQGEAIAQLQPPTPTLSSPPSRPLGLSQAIGNNIPNLCEFRWSHASRVVIAGEPNRKPLVTKGDSGSKGTVFLLAVILTPLTSWSARLPVMPIQRKSTSIKWLSVPSETILKPRCCS